MKIGIITFHRSNNYGTALQTFSLYRKLIELYPSCEVYIVDYYAERIKKGYRLIRFEHLRSFIYSLIRLPFSVKIHFSFSKFIKENFKLMDIKYVSCLDFLVCGSDQIWNPQITRGFDPYYFGCIDGFTGKTIIYAASDGGYLGNGKSYILKKYLMHINAISVRESTMLSSLNLYNNNISVVLDPVFLFDKENWCKIASNKKYQNYILIYRLAPDDKMLRDAYKLAKKKGLQIIQLRAFHPFRETFRGKRKMAIPSIHDFLSLFLHADYVFTSSFHGLAFSIVFNKQFYVYQQLINEKRNDRLHCILSEFNLIDRYDSYFNVEKIETIDYTNVNNLLQKRRDDSILFLKNNLICKAQD